MDIQIKYDNGQMNIHMDAFFPTSQARLNNLYYTGYCHRKKAVEYKQKVADTAAIIESRKHPNGVPLTKDELADMKEQNKHFKAVYAGCISDFNRCIRQKDLFLKHLEILEQRK